MKKISYVVLTFVFCLFLLFLSIFAMNSRIRFIDKKISEKEFEISKLKNQITKTSFEIQSKSLSDKIDVMKIDVIKNKQDSDTINQFLKTTLNWKGYKRYKKAREDGMAFCENNDNEFFMNFMPESKPFTIYARNNNGDSVKRTINQIDDGKMNSIFDRADIKYLSTQNKLRDYLVVFSIKTTKKGQSVGAKVGMFCSLDDSNKLKNIKVYPISGYFE